MIDRFMKYGVALVMVYCMWQSIAFSQTFTNVVNEQGITALLYNNFFGAGVSFADFDGDGWDDLSIGLTGQPCRIYRNNNGTLEPMPTIFGDFGAVKAFQWVDFDNDGDRDLFITARNGNMRLLRRDGEWQFTDITQSTGLHQNTTQNTYGASWGDYDRDGFLDLYVCNYTFSLSFGTPADKNHLYRNNGDGTFTDVTSIAGVAGNVDLSFQSLWVDYNQDLWPDLYVINDKSSPNRLYLNNTDGTFTEVTTTSGAGIIIDAMTASCADYNRDGLLDMYCTNTQGGNALLQGQPDFTFVDVAIPTNLIIYDFTWGTTWFDMDNDTDLDMYICEAEALAFNSPNYLYRNLGADAGFVFEDASNLLLNDNLSDAFVVASGDINNDGHIDIAVHNRAPYNFTLWQNSGTDNNYVKINLTGTLSNRDAAGSWIRLYVGGHEYIKYTFLGEQYLAQNSFNNHFGLGQATNVDSLHITWPSGWIDQFYNLDINQTHFINEGSSIQASIAASANAFCVSDSVTLTALDGTNVVWNTGATGSTLTVTEEGSYSYSAMSPFGFTIESASFEIIELALPELLVNQTSPLCFGEASGTLEVSLTNGDTATATLLVNGEISEWTVDDLFADSYQLTVTNTFGCTQSIAVELVQPDSIQLSVSTGSIACFGGSTQASASAIGGSGELNITWITGNPEALTAGAIEVIASDEMGCMASYTAEVSSPALLEASVSATDVSTDAGGSILVEVNGGTEPYTATWSGPNQFSSSEFVLSNLNPGAYSALIEDANGCFTFVSATILPLGIQEGISENQVLWFPNPTSGLITFTGTIQPHQTVVVYSAIGAIVFSTPMQQTVDLSGLAQGAYFIEVVKNTGERQAIQRLVID